MKISSLDSWLGQLVDSWQKKGRDTAAVFQDGAVMDAPSNPLSICNRGFNTELMQ